MRFYCLLFGRILKSLSFQRLWNLCVLYVSYCASRIWGNHVCKGMPAFISIEPTNICNLQCPECPTGNKSSIVPKGKIQLKLCKTLIPQIKQSVLFANLYFQGEPFVNESIIEIIKLAEDANIPTSISSNAHFITPQNADEIVKSGLTKLIISLDGYNQESYEKYRRNGSFQKVLDGMKAIQEAKKRQKSHFPLVELQCLLFKHTETHTDEIRAIGKLYGADIVAFKTAQFYDAQNIDMLPSNKNSRYSVTNGTLNIKKELKNRCWKMWSSCIIAWNGNVLPCCFDKNHTFAFGSLDSKNLEQIWHSEAYNSFRKTVHTNRKQIKMCQNCSE
ncbi:MAG: SPASM domain-containing protein [Bacteroidales bacterium]|nr:SPASM domain-containing protein [Bacteroidales bacterium]